MIREESGDPSAFPVPPASAANQNIPPPLSKNAQKREKKRLAYLQKKEERARERKPNHPIMRKRNLFHSQLKKSRKNGKNNELNFLLKMARLVRRPYLYFFGDLLLQLAQQRIMERKFEQICRSRGKRKEKKWRKFTSCIISDETVSSSGDINRCIILQCEI